MHGVKTNQNKASTDMKHLLRIFMEKARSLGCFSLPGSGDSSGSSSTPGPVLTQLVETIADGDTQLIQLNGSNTIHKLPVPTSNLKVLLYCL